VESPEAVHCRLAPPNNIFSGLSHKFSLAGNTAKGLVRQSHYLLSPEAFYTPSYFLQTSSL